MAQPTQGEWKARIATNSGRTYEHMRADIVVNGKTIAYLPELGHEDTNDELEANVRLMAAAPALLEALTAYVKAYTDEPAAQSQSPERRLELCQDALAAIRAAKGGE